MKNSWTIPKVKSFPLEVGKDWYVWFRFNGVLKFVKTGINKIPDYSERLEEINALADVLKEKLEKGWIPINTKAIIKKDYLTFNDALDFGLEKKKPSISAKTYLDYRCTTRFFKEAAKFFKHEYFCPNPYSIRRTTATNKWKKYVIDGLGIEVKCYSLKHKGANDKLKAGMDMKTISEMFGHSDEKMTEIYANFINQKRFKEAKLIQLEVF